MHPETGYIDQHPDALRLTLVEGSLDRRQFHLLAGETARFAGVRVEATVIGASHIVTLDAGPFVLHEVFACVGLKDVASWTLDELVAAPVERQFPGMHYEFTARRVLWQDPEPPELVSIVAAAHRDQTVHTAFGVVQDFPAGNLLVTPKTVIVGSVDEIRQEIVIETAHSYPNVHGLVMSRSTLSYT